MKRWNLSHYAISSCIVAALLAGCGGSQPPIGTADALQNTVGQRANAHLLGTASASGDLLYVSDLQGDLYILSYPKGVLKQTIIEPDYSPGDLCSDKRGNVFVIEDSEPGGVFEYAHGGSTPIATFKDDNQVPERCSVDDSTGDLAVVNANFPGKDGNVGIFAGPTGTPTYYTDPNLVSYDSCAYDENGDLFVDGLDANKHSHLAELPRGENTFTELALKDVGAPLGELQWVDGYLAMGSTSKNPRLRRTIYHVKISGTTGTIVGKTPVQGPRAQWWIHDNALIAPYAHRFEQPDWAVGFWKYPRGGEPAKVGAHRDFYRLNGLTISVAP
jgi:hypothetical protein